MPKAYNPAALRQLIERADARAEPVPREYRDEPWTWHDLQERLKAEPKQRELFET